MPLLKKKIYNLSPSPKDLKEGEELFVIPETNECFRSYDEYIAKVFLYSSQHWSCQYTGRSGLTFNDALSSEKGALKQLEKFPECFKEAVLKCIHKSEGKVKDLVEKCVKFLTTHYFLQEEVVLLNPKNGRKCPGVIIEVLNSNIRDMDSEKENEGIHGTAKQVFGWKYKVQLQGKEMVLTDISPDEMKHKTKLPSKELLRLFIKCSSERHSVEGKDMWLIQDDLVQKYDLPSVSKSKSGLKEQKNPLRSPLDTISGLNGNNVPEQKTKKISPKTNIDPSQRTLNFFVQTPKNKTQDNITPSKSKYEEKAKTSPVVVAELKICLTPRSKVQEVIETSSGKSKKDSTKKKDRGKTEKKAARTLFDVEQNQTDVLDKADEAERITVALQDEEKDFVLAKQKPKKGGKDCDKTASRNKVEGKKSKNSSEVINIVDVKKVDSSVKEKGDVKTKHDVITLDDAFSEKEKKIVKKNTLKKQKTLSQMFNINTSKKSSKVKNVQPAKINDVFPPRKPSGKDNAVVAGDAKNEKERFVPANIVLPSQPLAKNGFDLHVRFPLPSPKPVEVPEPLRRRYGDILMVTEFIHFFGNSFCEDGDLKYSPDDLVAGLISDGPKYDVFLRILIGFLKVLLQDLRQQESTKEFADIGVDLTDMEVSDSTVGELTRLYLKRCHKRTEKDGLETKNMSGNILLELERKDVVNLSAVQKLEILIYMLEQILTSEKFCSHSQDLEEARRMSWKKKLQLEGEIRQLVQEQKKLDDAKPDQKEIDTFLEKNSADDGDKAAGKEENDSAPESFNADEETKGKLPNNGLEAKEKDNKSCASTKRREMAAKSKAEKEKLDQLRYLSEELFRRTQKIDRLKETINQMRDCKRVEPLGCDRNHSRYWLFQSHPELLFVEKTVSPGTAATTPCQEEVTEGVISEESEKGPSSEETWHYYGTTGEVDQLILRLKFHDENENALMQKLKMHAKKLRLLKRKTSSSEECPSSSEEIPKESRPDELGKLKEQLCDLATRVNDGNMGYIGNLEDWSENVMSRSLLDDLVEMALKLGFSVKTKSLWKNLGDREEWLREKWVPAVKDAMTSSRLRFCIAMLDYCIIWDACCLFMKCRVCRRGAGLMAVCDNCHKGFHIGCLRPVLNDVPDEEWYCPACKRENERSTRRASSEQTVEKAASEVIEEEIQAENDDYCDVCGGAGEMICCDNCPKVYHKECHDPPLRNIPRGVWKCCSCQGRRPTARKRNLATVESVEYSDFETSQDDSADDSLYSESESGSDSGSESEVEDDSAAVERAERARRRELAREEKAKSKRSSKKRKVAKKKRKENAKGRFEKRSNEKYPERIRDVFNEDSSNESEEKNLPRKKQRKSGDCDRDSDDDCHQSSEETTRGSSRKRKCNSSEEDINVAKRRPRQNPELKMCENLLRDLIRHEDSWPFIEPVDISEVPDYIEIISNPMDFGTIKRKLMAFEYNNYQDCLSDIKLVFANSDQYNLDKSDHGLAGISLQACFKEILPNFFPKYDLQVAGVPKRSSRLRSGKRRR